MSVTDISTQRSPRLPDRPDAAQASGAAAQERIQALESEIRRMSEEFARLRDLVEEREKAGRTLLNAYREVISDFADLFESQRKDAVKRDESLRFFLGSIEGRIREDIRAELQGGGAVRSARRGIWPFRRREPVR